MRSMPRVVLPIWRPQAATLKRAASAIIVAWAGCGLGRSSELVLVGDERNPDEAKRLRCCGDASELIAENTVGDGQVTGGLGAAVGGITEDFGLGNHGTKPDVEVLGDEHLQVGSFFRCNGLHSGCGDPARE